MFKINPSAPGGARLTSDASLTPDDFDAITRALSQLGGRPAFAARKTGLVSSRLCVRPERVETRWNGAESTNTANPFDHIVTNLDKTGTPLVDKDGHQNIYVIPANRFTALYQPATAPNATGPVFRARTTVEVIDFPGGFEIIAPWGELQRADSGYLIRNGADIYGNNAETFSASYERVAAA